MEDIGKFFSDLSVTVGLKIVYALLILFIGIKLSKKLVKIVSKSHGFQKLDPSLQSFIRSFSTIALYVLVILTAAYVLGVPMTSFVAILASASAAIALALQGALGNMAGGAMILIFKPFKVGDFIETSDYSGKVKGVTVFYTYLETVDGKQITLPNGSLTNNVIVNYSANELRRVDLDFSVAYDADMELVKKLIIDTASAHPLTLDEPNPPFARMTRQDDSTLVFQLRVWCRNEDYWTVRYDLHEQMKTVFDANNIEIPFPQMDIHMR